MSAEMEILAQTLWKEKKHTQAVEVGLAQPPIESMRSEHDFTAVLMNLIYSIYSASELKLYDEYLKIFGKYIAIINRNIDIEPPNGYHNHAVLMQHNLMAVLFQYYRENKNAEDVKEAIGLVEFWTKMAPEKNKFEEPNSKLLKLSNLIFKSKHPYYIVDFRLPLSLPLPDGEYEINTIHGVKCISIESAEYNDLTSSIGDRHFSLVKITATGFTHTDNYWNGPAIGVVDVPFNINVCLKALNEIIFHAKLIREDFRLKTITHQDIGRSTTTQFNGDGEMFHFSMSLGIGGDALVDVISKQILNNNEVEELTEKLKSKKLTLSETLFSESLIEASNENRISAFYLLNSSCEAMIQKYMYIAAKENDKESEYELFMEGKSFCFSCDLYKSKPGNIDPPRIVMPPSLFTQLKFLKQIGVSDNREIKEMKRLLLQVKNDDLRNSLIHGRTNHVPRNAIAEAINGYKELKAMLEAIVHSRA